MNGYVCAKRINIGKREEHHALGQMKMNTQTLVVLLLSFSLWRGNCTTNNSPLRSIEDQVEAPKRESRLNEQQTDSTQMFVDDIFTDHNHAGYDSVTEDKLKDLVVQTQSLVFSKVKAAHSVDGIHQQAGTIEGEQVGRNEHGMNKQTKVSEDGTRSSMGLHHQNQYEKENDEEKGFFNLDRVNTLSVNHESRLQSGWYQDGDYYDGNRPQVPATGTLENGTKCSDVERDVKLCFDSNHLNVPVMLLDPNQNFAAFCRNVSQATSCLVGLVESCHRCQLNLTSMLDMFARMTSLQCPSDCDITGGAACYNDVMKRLLRAIIEGDDSVCQSYPRWLVENAKGCLLYSIGSCSYSVRQRVLRLQTRMMAVSEKACNDNNQETNEPKVVSCYKCYNMENQEKCNRQGIELCPADKQGCFTRIEYPMKVSKGCAQPGFCPTCQGKTCICSHCTRDLCNDDEASTATPTDPPTCEWQKALDCLTGLSRAIVRANLNGDDLSNVCRKEVRDAQNCTRDAVLKCTIATRRRVQQAQWFVMQLLDGACDPRCDGALGRSSVFRLKAMLDDGRKDICSVVDEIKLCVTNSIRDCPEATKLAVNGSLNEQILRIGDRCLEPITLMTNNVTLVEGTDSAVVGYTINRPPSSLCLNRTCKVFLELQLERGASPKCRSLQSITQAVMRLESEPHSSCSHEVTAANWREERELHVTSKVDGQYDGQQQRRLTMLMRCEYADGSTQTAPVGVVMLTIEDGDRSAACKSMSDPHITTFDNHYYHHQYEGHYYLYKHTSLPYQVQVVYQRCNDAATCACAVAVQSGDTVFVVDRCHRKSTVCPHFGGCVNLMRMRLYGWGRVTPGTRIYRKMGGRRFEILLPHGTLVKIDSRQQHFDVWITPSSFDFGRTRGLCGVYDGSKANDFTLPNGTRYNGVGKGKGEHPIPFCKAWRVPRRERIVYGVPENPYSPPVYCQCHVTSGDRNADCSATMLVERCDLDEDTDFTDQIQLSRPPTRQIFTRYPLSSSFPFSYPVHRAIGDPNHHMEDEILVDNEWIPKTNTWPSGMWTEAQAREKCEYDVPNKYIASRHCLQELGYLLKLKYKNDVISCVEDIKMSANADWTLSAVDSFITQCQEEMRRNTSFLEMPRSRERVKNLRGIICMNMCSGKGTCRRGLCRCNKGFTGEDCSLATTAVPSAVTLPDKGLCDMRTRDCSQVEVYVANVINNKRLACYVQEVTLTSEGVVSNASKGRLVPAEFLTYNQVSCLVRRNVSAWLAVSNDGRNFSDARLHIAFHSDCMRCYANDDRLEAVCVRKKESCIIAGQCYASGRISPNNKCLVCRPDVSPSSWYWNSGNQDCTSHAAGIAAVLVPFLVVLCSGTLLAALMYKRQKRRQRVTPQEASEISVTDATDVAPFDATEASGTQLLTSGFPIGRDVVLDLRKSKGVTGMVVETCDADGVPSAETIATAF